MKNKIVILLLLLAPLAVNAEVYKSEISNPPKEGFYKIAIPLEVEGLANSNLSNLILVNSRGENIPYLMRNIKSAITNSKSVKNIKSYTTKTISSNLTTDIIIDSNSDEEVSSFYLKTKNTKTAKLAKILGSDNKVDWYSIVDVIEILGVSTHDTSTSTQKISFPKSTYKYYKISIDDEQTAPIKVLEVYKVNTYTITNDANNTSDVFNIKAENLTHDISDNKTSKVLVALPNKLNINKLSLHISAPKFYNRDAYIYYSHNKSGLREISISNKSSIYNISRYCDSMNIDIYNGDNPNLTLDSVTYTISKREIIAYIDDFDQQHFIKFGGKAKAERDYDLSFVQYIPDTIEALEVSENISVITTEGNEDIIEDEVKDISIEEPSILMAWLEKYGIITIIIIAIVQLLYMVNKFINQKRD